MCVSKKMCVSKSQSLFAKVFKAKYFPNCSFLQAKVKPGCSYVWHSLAASRNVLEQGLKWRIGNGKSISICQDRWIPNQENGKIPYPITAIRSDVVVAELIDSARGVWKEDLVRSCFSPVDVEHILHYPLHPLQPADVLIWWGTSSSKFTIKSAYHSALSVLQVHSSPESSNFMGMQQFWQAVWSMQLSRKIQHFVWRLCLNILPTKDNLAKRNILSTPECPIYGVGAKSSIHVFRQCVFTKKVWEGNTLLLDLLVEGRQGILDWFWGIWKLKGEAALQEVAVVSWGLWNVRNSALFRDLIKIPSKVYLDALQYVKVYPEAQVQSECSRLPISTGRKGWTTPRKGWYKVNMDGAVFSDIKKVGVGVVIRNEFGEFLGAMSELLDFGLDATNAEAWAALYAIKFTAGMSF